MRKLPLLLAAVLAGCATRPAAVPEPPPVPPDANFVLVVDEAVAVPEEDHLSYVLVSIDGARAGKTREEPRSRRKEWGVRLEPGNRLFRFDLWHLEPAGDWKPLDSAWQPPERFYRVVPGERTVVTLRFYDASRKHEATVRRVPLPAP